MQTIGRVAACVFWLTCISMVAAQDVALEYPSAVVDGYDADNSCWAGMDELGNWSPAEPVVPELWLVGPPPSELSAVTIAQDHWIELLFSGRIVTRDGNDIELTEWGRAGEQAIVFLTDGIDREYAATLARADGSGGQEASYVGLDLAPIPGSFVPRAILLADVNNEGGLPGFDLGYIRALISHEPGPTALYPTPVNGDVDVAADRKLCWTPAADTVQQHLYLSDDESQVQQGDPNCRYVLELADANGFTPPALKLETTYYWRINGVGAEGPNEVAVGPVWSFTTTDRLTLDNFDLCFDADDIFNTWRARGHADLQLDEGGIFQSCYQSMRLGYFYDVASSSEACLDFSMPGDWAENGVTVLQLWLSGDPDNATNGRMYVALSDGQHLQRVFYEDDLSILTQIDWVPWRIALDQFDQIDLSHITSFAIGFRPAYTRFDPSGQGRIWIDDIELYPSLCLDAGSLTADVTEDCAVDYLDLDRMAQRWLEDRVLVVPVVEPCEPKLWYEFEGNVNDSIDTNHAQFYGRPAYDTGVHGQALRFASAADIIMLKDASAVFDGISQAMTIAFWLNADDSEHVTDTICCSNYTYGQSNPSISIVLGCWRNPGQYRWDCGWPWSFENRVAGRHQHKSEWAGRWNHWAFTKDVAAGRMNVYLNGVLYDTRSETLSPIDNVTSLELGGGWYGYYDGLMDDFQVYDYALSEAEVAYLASDGTGQLQWPSGLEMDLDGSDRVDLGDFSILADQWLENALWQGR